MAKLKKGNLEAEVKDGDSIIEAAEKIGVPFGCKAGMCQTCKIKVLKGMENLSEVNENEKEMGVQKNERLACQCKIKSGTVEIEL